MLHKDTISVICDSEEQSHDLQKRLQSINIHWMSGTVYLRNTLTLSIGISSITKKFCMMQGLYEKQMPYQEYVKKYLISQSNTNKMLKALKCTK